MVDESLVKRQISNQVAHRIDLCLGVKRTHVELLQLELMQRIISDDVVECIDRQYLFYTFNFFYAVGVMIELRQMIRGEKFFVAEADHHHAAIFPKLLLEILVSNQCAVVRRKYFGELIAELDLRSPKAHHRG